MLSYSHNDTEERSLKVTRSNDTVKKARDAQKRKARALLKSASGAVKQLEDDVHELVTMRAWEVLDYENFSVMWEEECGFKPPTYVKALATDVLREEGLNSSKGSAKPNGHTVVDVAEMIGFPITLDSRRGTEMSTAATAFCQQLKAGVPPEKVVSSNSIARQNISEYGTRARQQPRRIGKLADERVPENFQLRRGDADAISEIARKANVSKAEIYRQAVAEYLQRYNESRS